MRLSKTGQSVIEYTLIASLVILGVIVMGPYVIRSINAHFKIWDDSVQDSLDDPMISPSPDKIPDVHTTCQCTELVNRGCGGKGRFERCGPDQTYWSNDCSPAGCGFTTGKFKEECRPAAQTCCNEFLPTEECGTTPTDATTRPANNCYYGERIYRALCGDLTRIECHPDTTTTDGNKSCEAMCVGNPFTLDQKTVATFCTDDNKNLTRDTPTVLLQDSKLCSTAKCETYCGLIDGVQYFYKDAKCEHCGNGTCDQAVGETFDNCPSDCMGQCQERQISNAQVTTNVTANTFKEYTSPVFSQSALFNVDVWSDDLLFDVKFVDKDDRQIFAESCGQTTPLAGTLTPGGCGHDADTAINHYKVSYTANKMSLKVTEASSQPGAQLGYTVTARTPCQESCVDLNTLALTQLPTGYELNGNSQMKKPGVFAQPAGTNIYFMNETFHELNYSPSNYTSYKAVDPLAPPGVYEIRNAQGATITFKPNVPQGALVIRIFEPANGEHLVSFDLFERASNTKMFSFNGNVDHFLEIGFIKACTPKPEDQQCRPIVASATAHCDIGGNWGWRGEDYGATCPTGYTKISGQCPASAHRYDLGDGQIGCYYDNGIAGCSVDGGDECCFYMCQDLSKAACAQTTCPAAEVKYRSWNQTLNDFGIWAASANNAHMFTGLTTTYRSTFTTKTKDDYIITLETDDYGDVTIDGTSVCSQNVYGKWADEIKCPINALSAGTHTVVVHAKNDKDNSAGQTTWDQNPGGVAVKIIQKTTGNIILKTDSHWDASVDCPSGQTWDCASRSCTGTATAPTTPTTPNKPNIPLRDCGHVWYTLDDTGERLYPHSDGIVTIPPTASADDMNNICSELKHHLALAGLSNGLLTDIDPCPDNLNPNVRISYQCISGK